MKKRSLFVATAMLLVAVIACTSATYAWFITSTNATVENINVSVEAQGGIQISLDNSTWKTSITAAEIAAFDGYTVAGYGGVGTPGTLNVLDFEPSTGKFYSGTIGANGTDLTIGAVTTTGADADGIVKFTLYVRTTDTASGFKFADTSAVASTGGYVYAGFKKADDTSFKVVDGVGSGTYKCFSGPGNASINPATMIVESGVTLTPVTAQANFGTDVYGEGTTDSVAFEFVMWAEGQDPQCNGSASGTGSLTLSFTKVAPSVGG